MSVSPEQYATISIGFLASTSPNASAKGVEHAGTKESEYCIRSRTLGRWLMLPETDPRVTGGRARSDLLPAWPGLSQRRRGVCHPLLWTGQCSRGARRPLLRRHPDYPCRDG